ncbi:MAG TPA: hypothetical protein VGU25_15420 [Acidobacteriaceae bacterium]|nr:hypothetical protein [Acidobacteriaceae bacterium]
MPNVMRSTGRWAGRCAWAALAMCGVALGQTPELNTSATQTSRAGSEWTVHYADGGKAKYKLVPGIGEPGVAVFEDRSGHEVKILVAEDATVLIVPSEGGCYRTGKLVDGHVTNGTSGGECKPGGAWTAEMR